MRILVVGGWEDRDQGRPGRLPTKIMKVGEVTFGEDDHAFERDYHVCVENCHPLDRNDQIDSLKPFDDLVTTC